MHQTHFCKKGSILKEVDDQSGVTEEFLKNYCGISKKNGTMNADHEQRRMHVLHDMTVCRRYWVRYVEYR